MHYSSTVHTTRPIPKTLPFPARCVAAVSLAIKKQVCTAAQRRKVKIFLGERFQIQIEVILYLAFQELFKAQTYSRCNYANITKRVVSFPDNSRVISVSLDRNKPLSYLLPVFGLLFLKAQSLCLQSRKICIFFPCSLFKHIAVCKSRQGFWILFHRSLTK